MSDIVVRCCDGQEKYENQCLRNNCPNYRAAEKEVQTNWPYVGTGFGNLYGNPTHGHFLARVRKIFGKEDEFRLSSFLHSQNKGRSGQTITLPYDILKLPCGCKRYAIEGARPGSTGKLPVNCEFRLKQVGKSTQWRHTECGKAITAS